MSETLNYEVMAIDPPLVDQVKRWCKKSPMGCYGGEVLFEEEVYFLDRHFMAVRVVVSENPDKEECWTEGSLFNEYGHHCGSTPQTEEFLGTYQVGNYCVTVEKKDD